MKIGLFDSKPVRPKGFSTTSCNMLGVFVPQHISDYLVLSCINHQKTRSVTVRQLVTDWYDKEVQKTPAEDLCQQITDHLQKDWAASSSLLIDSSKEKNLLPQYFADFKSAAKKKLLQKGVHLQTVESIINKLKQ